MVSRHSGLSTWNSTNRQKDTQMAQAAFAPILSKKPSEVKAPPPMPVGTYIWVTKGLPRYDKSTKKGTPYAEFTVVCLGATDDVDPDLLEAIGGTKDKVKKLTFYHMFKDFLVNDLLIDVEDDEGNEKELAQVADESGGKQFLGTIGHEPSPDGKRIFDKITATAPLES
jgi:hypothetical protein